MSPKKAPSPPIVPPPPVDPSYYNMLGALPVAQQFMVLGHIKRLYSGLAAAGTTTYAAAIGTMTPVATAQTSIVGVTPESDRNVRRRLDFAPPNEAALDAMLSEKDEYGIHHIFGNALINHYLKKYSSPTIEVVVKELSTGPHPYYKFNAMQLLYTVLEMTGAPDAVISTVNKEREPKVPHTADNKNMPADDVIGFLTKNGVNLCKIPTKEYEVLLGMDHQKPIIIEYIATKHKFEADDVDYHWTIFCILFRKEQLLLPFNDTSAGLILGSQFMEQRWNERHNFEYFCKNNLHNKISPVVDRKTRENRSIRSTVTRKLVFNNAWTIVTPIKSEDMIL